MKSNENNIYGSIIPLIITVIIAFGGNYLFTTNKLSAMDAKVTIYQENIKELSDKMDKMNTYITSMRDQMIEMNGELKMKSDKKLVD